jgi:hypothetical protein
VSTRSSSPVAPALRDFTLSAGRPKPKVREAVRIRITDGTHEVEIKAKGYSRSRLDAAENAALRLLDALRDQQPAQPPTGFGFAADAALDSSTERSELYVEPGREDLEDEDGRA